ncbi:MAG: photosystem II reaction center protein Psb28 [Cyanothece sp. SIO1E1]|nr:photosystem II reaction center protein Psb28 [Cyanothece sp. SIO1E1]
MTRARDGSNGRAIFYFEKPTVFQSEDITQEITGMYMIDEEGELTTRDVKAKFVNGSPTALEVIYSMKSAEAWDRFMRFMERYAKKNNLGFNKS